MKVVSLESPAYMCPKCDEHRDFCLCDIKERKEKAQRSSKEKAQRSKKVLGIAAGAVVVETDGISTTTCTECDSEMKVVSLESPAYMCPKCDEHRDFCLCDIKERKEKAQRSSKEKAQRSKKVLGIAAGAVVIGFHILWQLLKATFNPPKSE